jgi:putative DNA primase/helicase
MNSRINLEANAAIRSLVGGANLTVNVIDIGSFQRQDDGTLTQVETGISIPEDDRPTYKVFEVSTDVEEHGKLRPGVWYFGMSKPPKGEPKPICHFICSPLYVIASISDGQMKHQSDFGLRLRFMNIHKTWTEWSMPLEMLAEPTELKKVLFRHGVEIDPHNSAQLQKYLLSEHPKERLICVSRVGWVDKGRRFVLPDKVYGYGADSYTFQSFVDYHMEYACAGTLDNWKTGVASFTSGNPVGMVFLSAAFAGPLLKLCGAEGGGLHGHGGSTLAKTTILIAAASVWGNPAPAKHVRSWKTTANGLEGITQLFNDNLLALDEIGQADPKEVGAVVYQVSNETGKQRANTSGGARPTASWQVFLLSTGEHSIATTIKEPGQKVKAGQEVRIVDLSVERKFGVYDDLHGHDDIAGISAAIRQAAATNHGKAGREFLEKLTKDMRADGLRDFRKEYADYRAKFTVPGGVSGQVRRVADKFALLAFAGELATDYGIVPWTEGNATVAAQMIFKVWLEKRPGKGKDNQEPHQIVDAVRSFLDRHGSSRFAPYSYDDHMTRDRAGWRDKDGDFYYFNGDGMNEALKGFEVERALKVLRDQKVLIPDSAGKNKTKKDPHNEKPQRLYVISTAALYREE